MPRIELTTAEKRKFLDDMSDAFGARAKEDRKFRDEFYRPQWEALHSKLVDVEDEVAELPDDETLRKYLNIGFPVLMDLQDKYDTTPDDQLTIGLDKSYEVAAGIADYITSPPVRSRMARIGAMREITGKPAADIAVPAGETRSSWVGRAADFALRGLNPWGEEHTPEPEGPYMGAEETARFGQQLTSASRRVLPPEATEEQRQSASAIAAMSQVSPNEMPLSGAERTQYYASRAAQGLHGLAGLGVGALTSAPGGGAWAGMPNPQVQLGGQELLSRIDPSQGDPNAGGAMGYLRQGAQELAPRTTPEETLFGGAAEIAATAPAYGVVGKALHPVSQATGIALGQAAPKLATLGKGLEAVRAGANRIPLFGGLVEKGALTESMVRHGPALLNAMETGVAFRGLNAVSEYGLYGPQAGVQALLDPEGWGMDVGFPVALRYGPRPGRTRIRAPKAQAPVGARVHTPASRAAEREAAAAAQGYVAPKARGGLTPGELAVVESEVVPVSPTERRPPMREATVPQPAELTTKHYPGTRVMVPEQQYGAQELLEYAKSGKRAGKGVVDLDEPTIRQRLIYDGMRADAMTPQGLQARLDMRDAIDYQLYLDGQKSMLDVLREKGSPITDDQLKELRPENVAELRRMAQGELFDENGTPVRQTHWALSMLSKMERLASAEYEKGLPKAGKGAAAAAPGTAAAPASAEFADQTLLQLEALLAGRSKSLGRTAEGRLGRPPRNLDELRQGLAMAKGGQKGWGTKAIEDNIATLERLRAEIERRRGGQAAPAAPAEATPGAGKLEVLAEKPAEVAEEFPEFKEPPPPGEEPPAGAAPPTEPTPPAPPPAPPAAAAPGGVERRGNFQARMEKFRSDVARIEEDASLSPKQRGEAVRALDRALQMESRRASDTAPGAADTRQRIARITEQLNEMYEQDKHETPEYDALIDELATLGEKVEPFVPEAAAPPATEAPAEAAPTAPAPVAAAPTPAPTPTPTKPGLRIAKDTAAWAKLKRANRGAVDVLATTKNNETILDPRNGDVWTKQRRGKHEGKKVKDGTLTNQEGVVIPVRSEDALNIASAHAALLARTEAPTTRKARRAVQARNVMMARRLANPQRSSMQEFHDKLLEPEVARDEGLLQTIEAQLREFLNPVLQRVPGARGIGVREVRVPSEEGERVVGRPTERVAPELQDLRETPGPTPPFTSFSGRGPFTEHGEIPGRPIMRRELENVEQGRLQEVETTVPMAELGPSAQTRRHEASYRLKTIPYETLLRATEAEGDIRAQRNAGGLNPEDRLTQSERTQLRTIRAVLGEGDGAQTARVEARLHRLPTDIRARAQAAIDQRKTQAMEVGQARTNVPMEAFSAGDLRSRFSGRTRFHSEEDIQQVQDRLELVRIARREQSWATDRGERVRVNVPLTRDGSQYDVERILPALPGATVHMRDGKRVQIPADTDVTRDRIYQAETDSIVVGDTKLFAGDIAFIEQARPGGLTPRQLETILNAVYDSSQIASDPIKLPGQERTEKPPVKHYVQLRDHLTMLSNEQLGALSAYMNFESGAKLPPGDLRKETSRIWGSRQRNSYLGGKGLQDIIYDTLVARARGNPAATKVGTVPEFVRKADLGKRKRIRMEEEITRRAGEMMAVEPRRPGAPKPEGAGVVLRKLERAYRMLRIGFERGNPMKVQRIRELGAVEPDITWTDKGLAEVQAAVDEIGALHPEDLKQLLGGMSLESVLLKRLQEDPSMEYFERASEMGLEGVRGAETFRRKVNKLADSRHSEAQALSMLMNIIGSVKNFKKSGKWDFERIATEYGTERKNLSQQEREAAMGAQAEVDTEARLAGQEEVSLTETGEGEATPYERAQAQRPHAFSGQRSRKELMNIVETALENRDKLEVTDEGDIADDLVAEAVELLNDPTEFDEARGHEANSLYISLSERLKRHNVKVTDLQEKYNPRTRKQGYVNLEQFLARKPEVGMEKRAELARRYVEKREAAKQRPLPQAAPRTVKMSYRKRGRMVSRQFMTRGAAGELISRIARELDVLTTEKPSKAQVDKAEALGTLAEQVHDYELSRQRYSTDAALLASGKPKKRLEILGEEKMTPSEQAAALAQEETTLNQRLVQLGAVAQKLGVKLPVALQIRMEVASAATPVAFEKMRVAAAEVPLVREVLKASPPEQLTKTTPEGKTTTYLVPYDRLAQTADLPRGRATLEARDKVTGKLHTTTRPVQDVLALLRSGKYTVEALRMNPQDVISAPVIEKGEIKQRSSAAIPDLVDFDTWVKYRRTLRDPRVDEVIAAAEGEEPGDGSE